MNITYAKFNRTGEILFPVFVLNSVNANEEMRLQTNIIEFSNHIN